MFRSRSIEAARSVLMGAGSIGWSARLQPSVRLPTEHQIRIDRFAMPPPFLGTELEDRKVQVRRSRRRVAARADVADHVAGRDAAAFTETVRVAFQVRVVVREASVRIELIDRVAAGFA